MYLSRRISRFTLNVRYFIVMVILLLVACEPSSRERPLGVVRLGAWQRFAQMEPGELVLHDYRLLLRRDERGWSAMSLLCTSDLSPLVRREANGSFEWYSELSGVTYDSEGNIRSGKARRRLPFYEIFVDQGPPNSPVMLYAYLGREKDPDWRLRPSM